MQGLLFPDMVSELPREKSSSDRIAVVELPDHNVEQHLRVADADDAVLVDAKRDRFGVKSHGHAPPLSIFQGFCHTSTGRPNAEGSSMPPAKRHEHCARPLGWPGSNCP